MRKEKKCSENYQKQKTIWMFKVREDYFDFFNKIKTIIKKCLKIVSAGHQQRVKAIHVAVRVAPKAPITCT